MLQSRLEIVLAQPLRAILALTLCAIACQANLATAQVWHQSNPGAVSTPTIHLPAQQPDTSIAINANQIQRWMEGQYEVLHCRGEVTLSQGNRLHKSNEAILWIDHQLDPEAKAKKVIAYLEGNVDIYQNRIAVRDEAESKKFEEKTVGRLTDETWFGRLVTVSNIHVSKTPTAIESTQAGAIWLRAQQVWDSEQVQLSAEAMNISPVQYQENVGTYPLIDRPILVSPQTGQTIVQPTITTPPMAAPGQNSSSVIQQPSIGSSGQPGFTDASFQTEQPLQPVTAYQGPAERGPVVNTRVRITPRQSTSNSGVRAIPSGLPGETIVTATGGVRVEIDSDEIGEVEGFGQPSTSKIIIEADSVVAWTNQLNGLAPSDQPARWEIYLEGNVEFIMGRRVVFAERMYYDAINRNGTVLNVEMLTPVENYRGLARLKAEVLQQNGDNNFQAYGAALTSSRLGVPRYWLQSETLDISRTQTQVPANINGVPQFDPQTGQIQTTDEYFVESRDNRVYLGGFPVFYWPVIRTRLDNPSLYLERIRVGNDQIFGTQVVAGFDLYQVFGLRAPRNTDWIGDIGYLTERGPVLGTEYKYDWNSYFGIPGDVDGQFIAWFVNDSGLDTLGRDRRNVPLEEDFRGRILWRHQHVFFPGFRLQGELGYLSDRNFLEQYYEREWDTSKDYNTGLTLLRNVDNQSFQLSANTRINDFFTQTNWLPRFDHHILGQSVFGTNLVWHAHSHIGYGQFEVAEAPTNPVDLGKFMLLDWESAEAKGIRAGTRQELDLPFQLGNVRVTPYVLGDATYWEEDLNQNDLTRLYGQTGIRTSLPMWRVDPTIHSVLFNLNGLAHKVAFDSEVLFADANENFNTLPLYDQLNDDAQEHFQRRFILDTFGGAIPARFDERFFALRSALQSNVSSPSAEIADDLAVVKLGMRNRLQTKRGLPGEARIIDWVEFDIEGSYFPDSARDNFGSDFGMVNYDFAWHVGDRLSVVSDGYYDFFSQGLRTTSIGFHATRPGNGNIYVGVRSIEGPISSNILTAQLTYRMSDKWIFRGASSVDFGSAGNIGQSASVIRVGESFLVRFGVNVNASRGNVGVIFGIEPRFLPRPRLGIVGGQPILPASATYLE